MGTLYLDNLDSLLVRFYLCLDTIMMKTKREIETNSTYKQYYDNCQSDKIGNKHVFSRLLLEEFSSAIECFTFLHR